MNTESAKLKIILPVGNVNSDKAKQALAVINNKFKEEVTIDSLYIGDEFPNDFILPTSDENAVD